MRKAEVRAVLVDGKPYEKKRDGSLVPLKGRTNWAKLARMTDAEIEAVAQSGEDTPMTDEEWRAAQSRTPTRSRSACASTTTCCVGSRRVGRAIRRASTPCCGGISRRNGRRGEG